MAVNISAAGVFFLADTGCPVTVFDPQHITHQPQQWWVNLLGGAMTMDDATRVAIDGVTAGIGVVARNERLHHHRHSEPVRVGDDRHDVSDALLLDLGRAGAMLVHVMQRRRIDALTGQADV